MRRRLRLRVRPWPKLRLRVARRGVTLVEVLVALVIFGVLSALAYGLLGSALNLGQRGGRDQTVVLTAGRYLETVRAQLVTPAGFDAPLPPAPGEAGGWTCQAASAPELEAPDPGVPERLRTEIRRVTLSCAHPQQGTQTFGVSFGRPP